ncbi:epidermal differentiation-specific protein-like [Bombina bombina]|uniref:epidermal differentiation-specific protein-like n=1 Tax=Bombina bombina TaxID=8345 RepID=UPI00235AEA31|nr:epidermal differentiation-specific protein-like [Bombina bombina]
MSNINIVLYVQEDCKGDHVTLTSDVPDLTVKQFMKKALSLKVFGDPWIVFTQINYKGDYTVYREGEHNDIKSMSSNIASLRVIPKGLQSPSITVYENVKYDGRHVEVTSPLSQLFNENGSPSFKVQQGAWILYGEENYSGNPTFVLSGDEEPGYWNNTMKSLKPISQSE